MPLDCLGLWVRGRPSVDKGDLTVKGSVDWVDAETADGYEEPFAVALETLSCRKCMVLR